VIVVAVDIGVTGAVAAIRPGGHAEVYDLPTVSVAGKRLVKRRISPSGLAEILGRLVPPGDVALAVIEDIHMRPGNGGAATASLSHSRGVVEAVLELRRIGVSVVSPVVWKRYMGLIGEGKASSLDLARGLYPDAAHHLQRAKDHNRAEALLLAHYGRKWLT
jgi:crossover junction endodeoxyribonuclease RuvC